MIDANVNTTIPPANPPVIMPTRHCLSPRIDIDICVAMLILGSGTLDASTESREVVGCASSDRSAVKACTVADVFSLVLKK